MNIENILRQKSCCETIVRAKSAHEEEESARRPLRLVKHPLRLCPSSRSSTRLSVAAPLFFSIAKNRTPDYHSHSYPDLDPNRHSRSSEKSKPRTEARRLFVFVSVSDCPPFMTRPAETAARNGENCPGIGSAASLSRVTGDERSSSNPYG